MRKGNDKDKWNVSCTKKKKKKDSEYLQREEQHLGIAATNGEKTEGAQRHFRSGEDPTCCTERSGNNCTPDFPLGVLGYVCQNEMLHFF